MNQSRRNALFGIAACGLGFCAAGCRSTPITNRRQLLFSPEHEEIELGVQAYRDTLREEKLSQNRDAAEIVRRVGHRIANVANRTDYNWEFNLIESDQQNAFALPGGKVAIYEGILEVCQNEAGLAVVMAHEVGHAIARHGGERMAQHTAVNIGKQVASKFTQNKYPDKTELVAQYYGAVTQYGILLPFSRKHEAEADHIGIILMAKAGYDPTAAPKFWQRFGDMKPTDQSPEWLSTHPADERRADNLMKLLDEANSEYDQATQKHGIGEALI